MAEMLPLLISKITKNTPNAVLINFEIPETEKEKFRFEAGQYLTVVTNINKKPERRSYSICSAPGEEIQIGIKEVAQGVFSTYANRVLKENDTLLVAPPEGRFQFASSQKAQRLVAFAAGSGITPIMSILKTALRDHPQHEVHLVYGNKSPEDTMFYDDLKSLAIASKGRLSIQWVFSRASVEGSLFGRIESNVVKNTLKNFGGKVDQFFLCGPEKMIEVVSETLKENGVSESSISFELFTSAGAAEALPEQQGASRLEIRYDEQSHYINLREGKSVLDVALQHKLDVPYSCQGGVCSSCIARVKSGSARMVSNQILTDEEVEEGLILTCQAHPTSPDLVVDYDDV